MFPCLECGGDVIAGLPHPDGLDRDTLFLNHIKSCSEQKLLEILTNLPFVYHQVARTEAERKRILSERLLALGEYVNRPRRDIA